MSTSIFIKTWDGDIEWLPYCLKSITKYASGIDEVVITADQSCVARVNKIAGSAKVYPVPEWPNGYIQQQWVKLNADMYTDADNILFVDSDCVFHTPFTPESYMRDGKPVLLKTIYGNLGGGEIWKSITSVVVGWEVEYEYMRRLPWMYKSSSLVKFREMFPKLVDYLLTVEDKYFSEFNAIGAYIDRFESSEYYVSDTAEWMPESVARQFWSWGGLTEEVLTEIGGYLNATN